MKELPPKYYTDITVDLPPRQRKAYDQMRKHMLAWVGEHEDQELSAPVIVAQLVRLQQFALASPAISYEQVKNRKTGELEERMKVVLEEPSAKADALEEIIEDADGPIVVFSQSRSMVDLVSARLERKRISVGRYTGKVPQPIRDRNVELFQAGKLRVLAGTIAAGGESIDLYRSSTVVFLDRHWSPSKNVQAEDRLHRMGQRDAVQVIDIIARNTVDLGRRAQIAQKWQQLKLLLGDEVNTEKYLEVTRGTS
jgi:SNF2 family DNA or RNA helicase